jgi:hypothetical protein
VWPVKVSFPALTLCLPRRLVNLNVTLAPSFSLKEKVVPSGGALLFRRAANALTLAGPCPLRQRR